MFCPNCGLPIAAGKKFCENCGTPLAQPADSQPAAQEAPAADTTPPMDQQPADAASPYAGAQAADAASAYAGAQQPGATSPYAGAQQYGAASPYAGAQQYGSPAPDAGSMPPNAGAPYAPGQTAQMPGAYNAAPNAGGFNGGPGYAAGAGGGAAGFSQQPGMPAPQEPKPGMSGKRIAIIAAIAAVVLIIVGIIGCNATRSSGGGESSAPSSPSASTSIPGGTIVSGSASSASSDSSDSFAGSPSASSASSASSDADEFVDVWELEKGTTSGLEEETIQTARELGLYVTMELESDGTGTFNLFSNPTAITWSATGPGKGTLDWSGATMNLMLAGGKLVIENAGETMTFKTASPEARASISGGNSGGNSGGSTSTAGMQTIGNMGTGTLKVPASWIDRTGDYDPNIVDSTMMVCYCDPDSEYTSSALGHYEYGQAIQMRVYPTSYKEITQQVIEGYADDMFGDVDSDETTFGGQKCSIITTSIPEDNLYICNLVLDRDGNGSATVLFTIQGTESTISDVMGYASTWQPAEL